MDEGFSEPTDWMGAAWAFAIWAAHFSAVWGASSALPGTPAARWLALAATLAALGGLATLWRVRPARSRGGILLFAIAMAGLAIAFSALPALVG